MANTKWDSEKLAQRARVAEVLARQPDLRFDKRALAEAAHVPVNRVAYVLAHLDDPVDTLKNVAERSGLDRKTVKRHAPAAGLALVDLRMEPIDDALVARLYRDEGLSLRAIARQTGYSPSGVSHALARAGVATRSGRQAAPPDVTDPTKAPVESVDPGLH